MMNISKYIKKAAAVTAAAAISITAAVSASATESEDFFAKGAQRDANGNKPGYEDLASLSNGAVQQQYYNDLYRASVDLWNSNEDISLLTLPTQDGGSITLCPIFGAPVENFIPGVTVTDTLEKQYKAMFEGYRGLMNLLNDNPLFYFYNTMSAVTLLNSQDGKTMIVVCVSPEYASAANRAAVQEEIKSFYSQAESKVEGLDTLAKKHKALYNFLCDNMTYAYQKDENGNYLLDENGNRKESLVTGDHSIVGPAVNKQGVCESYARSYELLCNFAGLDAICSVGLCGEDISDRNNVFGHAWNYIKLDDGKYYGIDATWDDQIGESSEMSTSSEYALNCSDGYSYYFFGAGKGRFLNGRRDCDHGTQEEYTLINMFEYVIDNIAGVVRENYDYYTPGDVNCDFEFDMRDLIRLGRYTVDPATPIVKGTANADGTGDISMTDAVYLQKSLLGYENTEPKVDVENYPYRK